MLEVWYIRHGESTANVGAATEDPATIPLTALGQEQAQKVSLAFPKAPDLIVTSNYTRARQTAQATANRFSQSPIEIWDIQEFTFLSPIALGNTNMYQRQPLSRTYWEKCDPNHIHGEGAESFQDFINRVQTMQKSICEMNGFIVVFSHGYVIKAALWANLIGTYKATPEYMHNFVAFHKTFDLPNCAIIKAKYYENEIFYSGLITKHLT